MSFLEGFMWLDTGNPTHPGEIFNNGRTYVNMVAARAAGLLPASFIFPANQDCDCYAYNLNPLLPMGPFDTLEACLPDCISTESLNHISPENPWYDATDSASSDFLGYWVLSVEGLDGRHNARNVTPRLGWPRGSHLSPLTPTHRTISYDILLVATSSCGLSYGMEWLEHKLASSCSTCALGEMYVRSCCPPTDDPDYGMWILKEVGLAEGPEWGEPPTDGSRGFVREATVSLYAGNPCRFSKAEICKMQDLWYGSPFVFPGAVGAYTNTCCILPPTTKPYDFCPVIKIVQPVTADGLPMQIHAYTGSSSSCSQYGNNRVVDEVQIMNIDLLGLPAGHTLTLDGSTRKIILNGPLTNYEDIDGSAYIDTSGGFVQWSVLACSEEYTAIKATVDDDVLADAYLAFAGSGGPTYASPTVTISTVRRAGC